MPNDQSEALAALMPELLRRARRIAPQGTGPEDLVQEALLRVWSRLQEGAEITDLRAYLMTALRNLSKRPARPMTALEDVDEPSVPPCVAARLATREVARAVAALPGDQGRLITALALEDVSYAELARRHGLPLGTVMSRISRGRARLVRRLGLPADAPVTALVGPEA